MKPEEFKEGMTVKLNGRKHVATDMELCGDGSYVVHLAVTGRDANLRVPIANVEVVQ